MNQVTRTIQYDQAQRQFASGDLAAALATCNQILAQRRNDLTALDLKGRICNAIGRHDEAEEIFRRCTSSKPREPRFHVLLAESMMFTGRFEQALASYRRAVEIKQNNVDALVGSADSLEKLARREEAKAIVQPLIDAGRREPKLVEVYGRLLMHDRDYERIVELITDVTQSDTLETEHRRGMLHLLGKAYERLGEVEQAFEAYSEANACVSVLFDCDQHEAEINDIIQTFSTESVNGMPHADGDTSLPIFVIGMPRSGTTLVERILHAHPVVHGGGELTILTEIMQDISLDIGSTRPCPQCYLDADNDDVNAYGNRYLNEARQLNSEAKHIVDKNLTNHLHLAMIQAMFPSSRVIYCQRNAEDTCLSCYSEPFAPYAHPYTTDLHALGVAYRLYARLMSHWERVLSLPIMTIRYEQLVEDQETWTRALLDFCQLPWNDSCLQFHEAKGVAPTLSYNQVRQPIYRQSVGRAKQFHKYLFPLREVLHETIDDT